MGPEEQGVRGHERYALIPRTLVFLFHGSRVLLLRGSPRKRIWPGRYNGLGGHVEPGESILTAARREMLEEAGISGVDLRLAGLVTVDVDPQRGVLVCVLHGELNSEPVLQPSVEGALEWVEVGRVEELPVVHDLPAFIHRLKDFAPDRPPFTAHSWYDAQGGFHIDFDAPEPP